MRLTIENILISLRDAAEEFARPGLPEEDLIESEAADLIEELLAVIRLFLADDPGSKDAARKAIEPIDRLAGQDPFRPI